jgi:replicative DNA helicase
MVYSAEVEKQFLAGLLNHPDKYVEIAAFISPKDFFFEPNRIIYSHLSVDYESGNFVDEVILAERLRLAQVSFEDNINVSDYIRALKLKRASISSVTESAVEIKKLSLRREIIGNAQGVIKEMKDLDPAKGMDHIFHQAESFYSKNSSLYENGDHAPQNVFAEMEELIEARGNNPQTEFGPRGPHPRLHSLYGSLLRPGNITTIVARTGVGKTQFVMDFCLKVSQNEGIPILHLDNGEMSKEELMMRQCAALSKIPLHLLETGQWRNAGEEIVNKVRSVWPLIKNYQFYYQNVGGMPVDTMIQMVKHFYYGHVKRGNKMILSFDYIKTTSENVGNKTEWQVVGEMVDKFKKLIQRDITCDGDPMISMMTSVQSNRTGITNNRHSDNIVEDDSIVSLSDRITQFSSHLFGLRQKTMDELAEEDNQFGTHRLTCFKYRHLGEDVHRAIQPVRMPTGDLKRNFINLDFDNFDITEVGDLQDVVDSQVDVSLTGQGTMDPLLDL